MPLSIHHCAFQEAVADTLEELWVSYNSIEKLKGVGVLKKLKVSKLVNFRSIAWYSLYVELAM